MKTSWPKNAPKSKDGICNTLKEMASALEQLQSDHEEYLANAQERGREQDVERHDEILGIIERALDSVNEAVSELDDWPAKE